ncbi:hypothetical protein EVAR_75333_1 [Eumeta japonica]|uniref:Uncharacterized protein n=1 Tax=Eumeta variegata TaxID=151549 RepID=A0A4C1Y2F9_EUMVA|nr:hypothetical protein EVAR_75333_1 [Eumeta japonica]
MGVVNELKSSHVRTPSPLPAWRGPESLPRSTPLPHVSFPVQHEGEFRTMLMSPNSIRTDDTTDESIHNQKSIDGLVVKNVGFELGGTAFDSD